MKNLDQPNNLQLYVEKTCSGIAPIKGENTPHLFSPLLLLITWAATKVNIWRGKEVIFQTNLNEHAFVRKIEIPEGAECMHRSLSRRFCKNCSTHQSPWNVQNYKKQYLYENYP